MVVPRRELTGRLAMLIDYLAPSKGRGRKAA